MLVTGSMIVGDSVETLVLFNHLSPEVLTVRRRNPTFWQSMLGLPFFCVTYYALVTRGGFTWSSLIPCCCAGIALLLAFMVCATCKKVVYARFTSLSGVPLLDIAKSGRDKSNFDDFVTQMQTAISNAHDGG